MHADIFYLDSKAGRTALRMAIDNIYSQSVATIGTLPAASLTFADLLYLKNVALMILTAWQHSQFMIFST
jgi:hypothetical protein